MQTFFLCRTLEGDEKYEMTETTLLLKPNSAVFPLAKDEEWEISVQVPLSAWGPCFTDDSYLEATANPHVNLPGIVNTVCEDGNVGHIIIAVEMFTTEGRYMVSKGLTKSCKQPLYKINFDISCRRFATMKCVMCLDTGVKLYYADY